MSKFIRGGIRYQLVEPGRWQWMEEYALATARYVLLCPSSRCCEYGSGVFSGGRPLGSLGKFRGLTEIKVVGAGAIHVRIGDAGTSCLVGIAQLDMTLISLNAAKSALSPSFWRDVYDDFEKWWREHHQNQMPPLDRP